MPRRRTSTHELRSAIDCLPRDTREAMLAGMQANDIIVGAYVDRGGGICPMLAAHRQGARIDFLPFARAWDGFTQARRARRATERELGILTAHLQDSLEADDQAEIDLRAAVVEHRALVARTVAERAGSEPRRVRRASAAERAGSEPRRVRRPSAADSVRPAERVRPVDRVRPRDPDRVRPGDPDRSRELRHRPGWSWLRPFRRVEELDRAVAAAAAADYAAAERAAAQRDTAQAADEAERQPAGLAF